MKTLVALLLAVAIPFQLPGQSPKPDPHYTGSELKNVIRDAQTPADFERLANHFEQESARYQAKSEAEDKELNRLLVLPYHARSYPTQVEITRDRIAHFKALSHKFAEEAAMYRERAKTAGLPNSGSLPQSN